MLILILLSSKLMAQDFHYSQFYNTQLLQNPALTGKFREDYRIGVAYRSQWKQINAPYATTSFSGEVNFRKGIDKWGLGLVAVNDQIGDGIYNNQYFMLSTAYHKTLDRLRRNKLSAGLQVGYVHKNIADNNLVFSSQISNYQATNNASGESLQNSVGYVNFNAGLFWDFVFSRKADIYVGASAYNLTQPKESFLVNDPISTPIRSNLFFGLNYNIIPTVTLLPAIQLTQQKGATDFNIGGAASYSILDGKLKTGSAIVGLWYRNKDAVIAYGALKYKKYQLGLSYDFTSSKLNDIKQSPNIGRGTSVGAFEITFIYLGFLNRALPNELTVPCRFF